MSENLTMNLSSSQKKNLIIHSYLTHQVVLLISLHLESVLEQHLEFIVCSLKKIELIVC